MTTMADLDDGTRVFHPRWNMTGTIRVLGSATEIRWDDCAVHCQVSDSGPVRPQDVEVIAGGAS